MQEGVQPRVARLGTSAAPPANPRKAHAVCVRKAGDAIGEKDSHFLGYPVSSFYTAFGYNPECNVAVQFLPQIDGYIA